MARSTDLAAEPLALLQIPMTISANVARCREAIIRALPLAPAPAPGPGLAVAVDIQPVWRPPTWADRFVPRWSNGTYQLGDVDEEPAIMYAPMAWARLDRAARRITIVGASRLADDPYLLTQPMLMPLLPPALRLFGLVPLHACAVDWRGRAVVLPAVSGSGKSTLALALLRGGFKLLADDLPVLRRAADGAPRLLGFREPTRLSRASLAFFPELAPGGPWAAPSGPKVALDLEALFGDCYAAESTPGVIAVPRIAGAAVSTLRPLPWRTALAELLAGMALGGTGAALGAALPLVADFVAACRTYALDTGMDFDTLPALLRDTLDAAP